MLKTRSLLIAAGLAAAMLALPARAVDTITAVHAFPASWVYSKSFLQFVSKVNAAGKGVVEIKVRGGPEAVGMFEQPNAVRDGVVEAKDWSLELTLALPGSAHALCEDYRASAGIDLEHDRLDRESGRTLDAPLLLLWGAEGVVHRCFDPLALWRRIATEVRGEALPCGHYIPEEAPAILLEKALPFLRTGR